MRKLQYLAGNEITACATSAKNQCEPGETVSFDFNGIECIVNESTDVELLVRDYLNAHLMEYKSVGPYCVVEYPQVVQDELNARRKAQQERQEAAQLSYQKETETKNARIIERTKGQVFSCKDAEALAKWEASNTDPYGGAIIKYAKRWALLMQVEMASGKPLQDIAEQTSRDADTEGITGYMYGAAVNVLATTWQYGEELRVWHNAQYKHSGDGIVNPAILTI